LFTLLDAGTSQPALYTLVLLGALLSILPLILLFFLLQRFWRVDLGAGSVK
jgi:multiple sugar transport system permease protein